MALNGVDISHYQEALNVKNIAGDFAIIKATQGTWYVNPSCNTHYLQTKESGKLRGLYHYAEGGSATAEAQFFVNNIRGYIKDALLALDWERGDNRLFGTSSANTWIKAWCDEVYRLTGVKPLVYVSASYRSQASGIGDYGLWIAQYANDNFTGYQDEVWNENAYSCAIRQYSSHGRLAGYNANLDLDKAYMDKAAWTKYANPSGSGQTAPAAQQQAAPQKKSVDELAREVIANLWGVNPDRANRLTAAGYDAAAVQAKVNELLGVVTLKSNEEIVNEVIAGKWGNGAARMNALTRAGYNAETIRAMVNQKLGATGPVYYPVQRNDTLSGIAAKYGTTYQKLAELNGIRPPYTIYAGTRIRVR